jgi:hypothetical protein
MKEKILEILKQNTHIELKYLGGEDEPIIVVNNSNGLEESDKDWFLGQIADEIVIALTEYTT